MRDPSPLLPAEAALAVPALEANLVGLWSRFGRGRDCRLHAEAEACWYETPLRTLPYNGVLRFTATAAADALLDRVVGRFRHRGVPFVWIVGPESAPADLDVRLERRGLAQVEVADGMWTDLAALPADCGPPPGIEIRAVEGERDLAGFLALARWRWGVADADAAALRGVAEGFELLVPDSAVRAWVAWRGELPVAKALLHCAAGAAGLYAVATRPEARGQGLARALTLHAFAAARRDGYRLGVLHSTPAARSLYARLGFVSAAPFRVFAPPGSFHL